MCPLSGLSSAATHAQRGGLARAVEAQHRGDAAIGSLQRHAAHRLDHARLAPRPGSKRLCSWSTLIIRLGTDAGLPERHEQPRPRQRRGTRARSPSAPSAVVRRFDETQHRIAHARQRHHAVPGVEHHRVLAPCAPSACATRCTVARRRWDRRRPTAPRSRPAPGRIVVERRDRRSPRGHARARLFVGCARTRGRTAHSPAPSRAAAACARHVFRAHHRKVHAGVQA